MQNELLKIEAPEPWPPPPAQRKGRPPKPEAERLSEVLNFRVTPDEANSAYRYAIRHGKPLNAVLRAMLVRFLRAV